ncbi:uncharacterized protein NPIL_318151, partial [Nephila pilipes]
MNFPKKLIIAMHNYSQITEIHRDESGALRFGGVDGKLLDILSKTLKFRYDYVSAPDGEWGSLSEFGNWTGLIGMVSERQADMAIGFLAATKNRLEVVDFSEPYSVNELSFATHLPRNLVRTYFYLYPFNWSVWVCIFGFSFILPLIFFLQTHKMYSYFGLLFQMYRFIVRQNMSKFATGKKFLFGLWLYFAFVISASYMAVLLSIMSVENIEIPIRNFEELSRAVSEKKYRVLSPVSITKYLINCKEEYVIYLANAILENNWFPDLGHSLDEENFDGKTAVLGVKTMFALRFGMPPYSTKYVSDAILESVDIGLAVRKDFCCKKELDLVIKRIKQAGLYQKFLNDEMYKTWVMTSKKTSKSKNKIITLKNMFGALLILICGFILAILVLVLEICLKYIQN